MGFFTDLKQDLSQAVDEMAAGEDENAVEDTAQENTGTAETGGMHGDGFGSMETDSDMSDVDLAAMLDKVAGNAMEADRINEGDADADTDENVIPVIDESPAEEETEAEDTGIENTETENQETENQETENTWAEHAEEASVQQPDADPEEADMHENAYQSDEAGETAAEQSTDELIPDAEEKELSDGISDKNTYYNEKGSNEMSDNDEEMTPVDETASVTAGMTINGDIKSAGSLDMIGTVTGNIDILGKLNITGTINGDSKAAEIYAESAKITGELHSSGSVKVGQSTVIIGNVFATSAVIAGAVKGDIDVQGPVILDTSAIVMGNIKSKSVQINNGAVIEGMCSQCYADVNPSSFFEEFKKQK